MSTVDRILELVKESGLTAKEFAEGANIAGGSITDWKTGRSKPSVESLQKIAKYCNVQLEWLTGDSDYRTKEEALEHFIDNQNRIVTLQTIQLNYDKVIDCNLNEKDIDEIVELLNFRHLTSSPKEYYVNYIKKYLDKFEPQKKKKIKDLFIEILKAMIRQIDNNHYYHYLVSSIEKMISSNHSNNKSNDNKLFYIPIVGKIAAGKPILAEEYLEDYLPIDPSIYGLNTSDDLFFLKVSGESMNLKVHNGDYALIHKQDYAENGDIIVAIVNGDDEATLKRYKKINNEIIMLEPMSTYPMEPIIINLKETNFKIIGKAIGQFGKF
jgi:SOS regulatory protein LexA